MLETALNETVSVKPLFQTEMSTFTFVCLIYHSLRTDKCGILSGILTQDSLKMLCDSLDDSSWIEFKRMLSGG